MEEEKSTKCIFVKRFCAWEKKKMIIRVHIIIKRPSHMSLVLYQSPTPDTEFSCGQNVAIWWSRVSVLAKMERFFSFLFIFKNFEAIQKLQNFKIIKITGKKNVFKILRKLQQIQQHAKNLAKGFSHGQFWLIVKTRL